MNNDPQPSPTEIEGYPLSPAQNRAFKAYHNKEISASNIILTWDEPENFKLVSSLLEKNISSQSIFSTKIHDQNSNQLQVVGAGTVNCITINSDGFTNAINNPFIYNGTETLRIIYEVHGDQLHRLALVSPPYISDIDGLLQLISSEIYSDDLSFQHFSEWCLENNDNIKPQINEPSKFDLNTTDTTTKNSIITSTSKFHKKEVIDPKYAVVTASAALLPYFAEIDGDFSFCHLSFNGQLVDDFSLISGPFRLADLLRIPRIVKSANEFSTAIHLQIEETINQQAFNQHLNSNQPIGLITVVEIPVRAKPFQNAHLEISTEANADLEVQILLEGNRVEVTAISSTDICDDAILADLTKRTCHVLTQAPQAMLKTVGDLGGLKQPIHPPVKIKKGSITHLLSETVAQSPDSTAIVVANKSHSFSELNDAVIRIAAVLAEQFSPKDRILIFADRSFDAAVAMFGILRAGMTCVPILKDFPDERIRHIAIVSKATGAIAEPQEMARAESLLDIPTIPALGHLAAKAPIDKSTGTDEAYILFTSGSTGEPKGVVVAQHSVLNLLDALSKRIFTDSTQKLRLSVNAPMGFDASMKQFFQIALGHTLIPVPADVRIDPVAMINFAVEQQLSVLDVTPTILKAMISAGFGSSPTQMPKQLLVGGEAIDQALWDNVRAWPSCDVWNVYGPTEATVNTLVANVKDFEKITIGHPLEGVSVACIDPQGNELPIGAIGELQIAGAGVAIGYIGASEEENNHFSFTDEGVPYYNSGDFVRRLSDDTFEFIGRRDDQVKVGGQRLELGEIESRIKQQAGVLDAAVIIDKTIEGDPRILAGVVTDKPLSHAKENKDELIVEVPSGHRIASINRNETQYQYKEIFEDRIYIDDNFVYPEDAVILDVGANIGMFSLFVSQFIPKAKIYAFEPLEPIREKLLLNTTRYMPNISVLPMGLSDTARDETFTYYPGYSMMSSQKIYADASDERDVIASYLGKAAESGDESASILVDNIDSVLEGRFDAEYHSCQLRRLSDVIDEQGIERIDVLKIDVQRAELDVLRGIDSRHFPMIRAISMELHDDPDGMTSGRGQEIRALLEQVGFTVLMEQDPFLVGTDRWNLVAYQTKPSLSAPTSIVEFPATSPLNQVITQDSLINALREVLPSYMLPRDLLLLNDLPRTPQGKLDKSKLMQLIDNAHSMAAEETKSHKESNTTALDTNATLLKIWQDVLRKPNLNINDDFFNNGGDSIRAILMQSKARDVGIEISLKDLHDTPTIVGLLPQTQQVTVSNGNPAEVSTLLNIWREVLRKPNLSINDDFFNNGGDSIRAILMQSKAREAGIEISLKDLHDSPTIVGLLPQTQQNAPSFNDTSIEVSTLLAIWCEVLRKPNLSINDDFFNNGGDSIRAILMQSKAREAGIEISLKDLHDKPTIKGLLADTLTNAITAAPTAVITPASIMQAGERRWNATSMQRLKLLASITRDDARVFHNATITPVLIAFDADKFKQALYDTRIAHPILTSRILLEEDDLSFVFDPNTVDGNYAYQDLTSLSSSEQEQQVTNAVFAERNTPFDPYQGNLVRFSILERGESFFEILVGEHHSVLDGYSLNAIIREVVERYCDVAVNITDDITVFNSVIQTEKHTDENQSAIEFWNKRFDNIALPKAFASIRPRPQTADMKQVNVLSSQKLFTTLSTCSQRAGVSTKAVLFALHVEALHQAFNNKPSQVGVVYSLRPEVEGSLAAIGNFLNVLPVPTAQDDDFLNEAKNFDQFDRSVFSHKYISHEKLSEKLGPIAEIQTVYNFIQFAEPDKKKGDIHETERRFFAVDAMMPLSVDWDLSADQLDLGFQYDANRVDDKLVEHLQQSFQEVVNQFLESEAENKMNAGSTQDKVLSILSKALDHQPNEDDALEDLGLNSLQMVRIARWLMTEFNTKFSLVSFLTLETIADVITFCKDFNKESLTLSFVELTPSMSKPKVRLIGFQQVGVAPSILDPWCDLVPKDVSIHALRYPDFSALSDLSAFSFDQFIDGLVESLIPLSNEPMIFVGGCFGAVLAYEAACRMATQPVGMVCIGSNAPCIDGPAPTYHQMDDAKLKSELVRMKSMPEHLLNNDDFLSPVFLALRGMSQLATTYQPKMAPLNNCQLTSIWPRFDVTVTKQDMVDWGTLTTGGFTLAEIDGEHAVLMDDPDGVYNVSGLSKLLQQYVVPENALA